MALDPGSRAWTGSPESSGRDSPIPRQWRSQPGGDEALPKDKAYRRYASGVEKALALFETALEEWADYISFLNRALKALQAQPSSNTTIPAKALLSKRLSQCLNPTLPSGVHQKALEVYNYVFDTIGADGLSRDLPLYLPGLAPTLSFASLSVRSPFLELLEKHLIKLDARSLRPAMRSIILALLPGLEDETSEDFDRTLKLVGSFKKAIRPADSKKLTEHHSVGDDFFWQCFFLASITSHSRRGGALAYLVRHLPALGASAGASDADQRSRELATIVTSPEPGLLVRCFASGLADEQVLIQRGFLDLLVSHLPLDSTVLQTRVKTSDLELLLKSAVGVVIRRDMSLNRRLWAWLLGPEPAVLETEHTHDTAGAQAEQQHADLSARTQYFEEHGLAALTRALLGMIKDAESSSVSERARPYRICLSLMDRWEIGGLVVPEIFLPVVQSVQRFKQKASSPADFKEVLRSASVFFDGIESGLIYSEIVALLARAIGPGDLGTEQRSEKLSLVSFIIANFNVREEEMVTIHAPLTCLAALYMLEDLRERQAMAGAVAIELANEVLSIVSSLLDLVPERTFPVPSTNATPGSKALSLSNMDLLKKIRNFYVNEQGNLDVSPAPFTALECGQLLIQKAAKNVYDRDEKAGLSAEINMRVRIFLQVLTKTPRQYEFEEEELLLFTSQEVSDGKFLPFAAFSSILTMSLFGSMVSGVFQSDAPQGRSATANDRLTVILAFQDALRICYNIWSWGQGDDVAASDSSAAASFMYTSLRMRNRARRLLEHLFTAETLECLETIVDIWKQAGSDAQKSEVFKFLAALEASRPRQTVPSIFNAIYSRTNPTALDLSRTSTLTISLEDIDLGFFLVKYTQSLDDDAMDEIWQDCIIFLKDILANPFPHRQTLPSLLQFAAILGEKVDNTNFGEQRKMRRELGDLFIKLLAALFTTRPITFTESTASNGTTEKSTKGDATDARDVVDILATVVPSLSKVLPEPDRVLSAAGTISANVIGPTLRTKTFPDSVTRSTVRLIHELSRLPNNQRSWKKDVGDAFNDGRFFGMPLSLVADDWLPLLRQWTASDKERLPEVVGRIAAPTTAGIVFGVGATSARLEADRKSQLNLRRAATLILAGAHDAFVSDLPTVVGKLVELLAATSTSSPSSTTRADVYMVMRALVLRTDPVHLAGLWPIVGAELHAALSSVAAPDGSSAAEMHAAAAVLQACKLLDLLVCLAPDDFQLREWLFITDSVDAVYRSSSSRPVALADELAEDLGSAAATSTTTTHHEDGGVLAAAATMQRGRRHPLIGPGGIADDSVGLDRRDELVAKVLRPFFAQLSIFAFESTYAMGAPDVPGCVQSLLRDLFDDRTIVKAL
ncbi:cellular morphogenesis regulator DopA [Cordyceps fumosorosea ARSEF 2679]|uniref:Cellular morphogenesis regulator DopA n=1 Tax=Cordyceps fumosorosea (strain ARSEF 2679) TaxID=1081104 RepID=A0A168EMU3_CORFA|nr:cellular morphogenesis regulator DopA [Cordyceps fumosorosea ARSEF 2679]OAA74000.1 cellular morphogenesis regulator DopA [Cordyceps fumosorosea ARSEF 2679]